MSAPGKIILVDLALVAIAGAIGFSLGRSSPNPPVATSSTATDEQAKAASRAMTFTPPPAPRQGQQP